MMDTRQLLLDFSSMTGVSGREEEVVQYAAELLSRFGTTRTTPLGSLICTVRPPKEGGMHIMLDAHIDEIGMIVTCLDDGFLRVAGCGGMDRRLLSAAPVTVHTKTGPLSGVICSVPPHLSGPDEKRNQKVDEVRIDIGFGAEQAEKLVAPGDRVTLRGVAEPLLNNLVSGKANDDRAGCVVLLKALEYLGDQNLDCGLSVVFSSMEEIGGQGAKTAAWILKPTHALAVDVSYAWTPDAKKEKCGILGEGPMIGQAPILSRALSELLTRLAAENRLPHQQEIMGGKTGTNADHIVTTCGGVETALVSIPEKYMHTPIETVSVDDVENTAKLVAAFIRSLDREGGKRL